MGKKMGKSGRTKGARKEKLASAPVATSSPEVAAVRMATPVSHVGIALSDDKSLVTMNVTAAGMVTSLRLTADQVDAMIGAMAATRPHMQPPIAATIPAGTALKAVLDPRFRIGPEEKSGGMTLLLRHPGIGWVGYVFPKSEMERIGQFVSRRMGTGGNGAKTAPDA
jgi:hypothetical protein